MNNIFKITIIVLGLIYGQSADQIKQAKAMVEQRGMSKNQVKELAKKQGYSEKDIDVMMDKGQSSQIKNSNTAIDLVEPENLSDLEQSNNTSDGDETNLDNFEIVEDMELKLESQSQSPIKSLNYFGYDIFSRNPALFQETSVGIVDPDYLIGPGDEIIVMLWGETQFRQVLKVDREGFVFIPEIGQVFVNGLNLSLLESKLFRVFSQSYASLKPQGGRAPTTFLDLSLGNLRPLRIQVLGEVAQPGSYTVSPSTTLFSALYYFNGPTTLGSLREIQLIRGGERITTIDFYDYLLTGKKPKDQKLQLDDVIFIPRRLKTVSIEGEVNKSGIYELKPNESLTDIISLAGDLKVTAYLKRAQIDRIVPFDKRADLGMDRVFNDVNLEQIFKSESQVPLQDGDRIQIFSVLDLRLNIVDLRGAITRPGIYDLGDSLKLSELIKKADGVRGDVYLNRVDIVRVNPDFSERLIKLNLGKAINGELEDDIYLQAMDRVQIYGTSEMISKNYVTINGNVKQAGVYLLQENMTAYDLIFKAGGVLDEEYNKSTFMGRADLFRMDDDNVSRTLRAFNLRKLLENPNSEADFLLEPNDVIRIHNVDIFVSDKPVTINGVVRNPNTYELKKGMTLKDLIIEAEGLNSKVYRYRVEVARIDPLNDDLDEYAEIITFNMNEKFSYNSSVSNKGIDKKFLSASGSFLLKPYDLISIRPDPYFNDQSRVNISGEVLYPGDYVILSPYEKITDIINRAGGVKSSAYLEGSRFIRANEVVNISLSKVIKNPKSGLNSTVRNGDAIVIGTKPEIIKLEGEINVPGNYKYIPGKRLRYYLNRAGGLSSNADKKGIWVQYPNGISKKYGLFSLFSPKIIDGSSIVINREKDQEPFDKTEYAKELTSILANFAQIISIVLIADKSNAN